MSLSSPIEAIRGVDGVRAMVLGRESRGHLTAAVRGMLAPGWSLESFQLQRTKFKPGRKLSAWYVAELRDRASESRRAHHVAVTWTAEEPELDRDLVDRLHGEVAASGAASCLASLRQWIPPLGLHLLASPLDPRFPGLVGLSRAGVLGEGADGGVETLRYRPGQRHVLRHGVREATLFVKMSTAQDVGHVAATAAALSAWLQHQSGDVSVLRPLRTLPREEAAVYRRVPGSALPADRHSLRVAGAALRVLHTAPVGATSIRGRGIPEEAEAVARAAEHIEALSPSLATGFHATLASVAAVAEGLPAERRGIVHGDFKLDHVWSHEGRVTLLDLDRCRRGDPALDLGKMLADIGWRCLSGAATDDARDLEIAFLEGYADGDSERVRRARVYQALFSLKAAARRVPVTDSRFHVWVAALLHQADRAAGAAERPRIGALGA